MQQQQCTISQENFLDESLRELEVTNKELSKLIHKKEELTKNIISSLGHKHEGQKSYEYNTWKIEVKTPCIYSLDKKTYQSGKFSFPKKFNPIKESVSYSIDKKLFEKCMEEAPDDIRNSLSDLIEIKPSKPVVMLKERTS